MSGEAFPSESVSETDLESGLAGNLAAAADGESWTEPPLPELAALGPDPRRAPMVCSSFWYALPSGELPAL
jgi:hypothetical protein